MGNNPPSKTLFSHVGKFNILPPLTNFRHLTIIGIITKDHTVDYVFATTLLYPDQYDSRVALRAPGPEGRFLD